MLCITHTKLGHSVPENYINKRLYNFGPSAVSVFSTWNPLFRPGVIITQSEKTNRVIHFEMHFVEQLILRWR